MATDQVEINAGSQEINDSLSRLVVLEHINDLLRIHHYVPYGHIPYNVQSHIHMYKCKQKCFEKCIFMIFQVLTKKTHVPVV